MKKPITSVFEERRMSGGLQSTLCILNELYHIVNIRDQKREYIIRLFVSSLQLFKNIKLVNSLKIFLGERSDISFIEDM